MKKLIALIISFVLILNGFVLCFADDEVCTYLFDGERWLCEEHYVVDDLTREDDYCYTCYFLSKSGMFSTRAVGDSSLYSYTTVTPTIRQTNDGGEGTTSTRTCTAVGTNPVFFYYGSGWVNYFNWIRFNETITLSGTNWITFQFYGGRSYELYTDFSVYSGSVFSLYSDTPSSSTLIGTVNIADYGSMGADGVVTMEFPLEYTGTISNLYITMSTMPSALFMDGHFTSVGYYINGGSTPPGGGTDDPQPPTESDKWLDDQYSGAVNPDLEGNIDRANSGIEEMDSFESEVFGKLEEYNNEVDVSTYNLPSQFVGSLSFVTTKFTDFFNGLGDLKLIVLFPLYLGITLYLLGRASLVLGRRGKGE